MRVLLDTNIIMDALQERQPFDAEAKEILRRGENKEIEVLLTANAMTDIFYLYSKARTVQAARSAVSFLLRTYRIVAVTHDDSTAALMLPIDDFEDALMIQCARKSKVEYLISRDDKLLLWSGQPPVISPRMFLGGDDCRRSSLR